MRLLAGRERTHSVCGGFTLVELLVGASIAAVVLSAAYGWLWNVAVLADRADDGAQAATLAGALSRSLAADAHASVRVIEPPSGRDPSRSLALAHDHVSGAVETILIAWDPARGVVWRNASGTYVADHIDDFAVSYVLAGGALVDGAHMSSLDWDSVRALRVDLGASVGSATVHRRVEASVGAS